MEYSIRGIKTLVKDNPDEGKFFADRLIKNTSCTLMIRGMKGCRVFCTNKNLAHYFRTKRTRSTEVDNYEVGNFDLPMVAEQKREYRAIE